MIRLRSWVQDALGVYVLLIIIKRKELGPDGFTIAFFQSC